MGFSPLGGAAGMMFTFVPAMVILGFAGVLIVIIVRLAGSARQWKRNNGSPVLTVDAAVVTKRSNVLYHHHAPANGMQAMTSSSTEYFVTFQVESGDRMELKVRDTEYGLLAENDRGRLTFQGTRYLGFERDREDPNSRVQ